MPKPGKRQLSDKMQERNPLDMRQQIVPVDILTTEKMQRTDTPNSESELIISMTNSKNDTERLAKDTERTEDINNKTEDPKSGKKPNTNAEQISERMISITNTKNNDELLTEWSERAEDTNSKADDFKREKKPNVNAERTQKQKQRIPNKQNTRADGSRRTVLQELRQGAEEVMIPHTERYSFEIYPDQKNHIKELQDLYLQKTGRKLSASRILREGLDMYLEKAFQLLNEKA